MVVGLLAFGIFSYLAQPGPMQTKYYEADAAGNLKLVDRPSLPTRKPTIPLALLKPEPTLILDHAVSLGLQSAQRSELVRLARDWQGKRTAFHNKMAEAQKAGQPSTGVRTSMTELKGSLADYSRLSVEYDLERQEFWKLALAVLDDAQRHRVERFLAGGNL